MSFTLFGGGLFMKCNVIYYINSHSIWPTGAHKGRNQFIMICCAVVCQMGWTQSRASCCFVYLLHILLTDWPAFPEILKLKFNLHCSTLCFQNKVHWRVHHEKVDDINAPSDSHSYRWELSLNKIRICNRKVKNELGFFFFIQHIQWNLILMSQL